MNGISFFLGMLIGALSACVGIFVGFGILFGQAMSRLERIEKATVVIQETVERVRAIPTVRPRGEIGAAE